MKLENKVNLCTCNNCENIFIDKNPQIGAKEYLVDLTKITSLQYLLDNSLKNEIDGGEYFWGCGICGTDDYLTDEVNETEAKDLGIIH